MREKAKATNKYKSNSLPFENEQKKKSTRASTSKLTESFTSFLALRLVSISPTFNLSRTLCD